MGMEIANDPSETKNRSLSIPKGTGKRGWESLAETDHRNDNQEDGGGGSRVCTETPHVGRRFELLLPASPSQTHPCRWPFGQAPGKG